MLDKGYRFPLYSLNLTATAPDDSTTRYSLLVPEGRLCVAPLWLGRARHVATLRMLRPLSRMILLAEAFPAELPQAGISAGWLASMRHWRGELVQTIQESFLMELEQPSLEQAWGEHERTLTEQWARLWLGLRLAEVFLPGVARALPRQSAARAAALAHAQRALQLLPPQGDALTAALIRKTLVLLKARAGLQAKREALAAAQVRAQDRSLVLRAALMGDLMRCSEAARVVLRPTLAALFTYDRIFPSHARPGRRRDRQPAPPP